MEMNKSVGFLGQAKKRKDSFIHLALMGGVLLLSMRCVGQKYRIRDLEEQRCWLQEENHSLENEMCKWREGLLEDNNRAFMSKLRPLFGDILSEPGVAGENRTEPSKRFGV